MGISIFLARVLGLYMVIITLAFLIRPKQLMEMLETVIESKAVLFLAMLYALILGLLMVVAHNIWVMDWRVLVTLLAWWVLIKGLLGLFMPDMLLKMAKSMRPGNVYCYISLVITFVIGGFLVYHGFFNIL